MRWLRAPAKINLTLRVIGRRADGYHELESLVAFAGLGDWIGFEPGRNLVLEVFGPRAVETGPVDENLVLRAARALAPHIGEKLGRFRLVKRLPAAAGLGGGSADAAAALRLLANEARLSVDDPRVRAAARATGADVLVCLHPHARMMTGVGDRTRSIDPAAKNVRCSRQSPGPGANAQGFRRAWARTRLDPRIVSPIVRRDWTGCGGHPGFSRLHPKRPGSGGSAHSAGDRRRASEIGADSGGRRDGNVRIGSNLLCLVRRSPQCDYSAAHSRRGTSGLVGRGYRHPLVQGIAAMRMAFAPQSLERAASQSTMTPGEG